MNRLFSFFAPAIARSEVANRHDWYLLSRPLIFRKLSGCHPEGWQFGRLRNINAVQGCCISMLGLLLRMMV